MYNKIKVITNTILLTFEKVFHLVVNNNKYVKTIKSVDIIILTKK